MFATSLQASRARLAEFRRSVRTPLSVVESRIPTGEHFLVASVIVGIAISIIVYVRSVPFHALLTMRMLARFTILALLVTALVFVDASPWFEILFGVFIVFVIIAHLTRPAIEANDEDQ